MFETTNQQRSGLHPKQISGFRDVEHKLSGLCIPRNDSSVQRCRQNGSTATTLDGHDASFVVRTGPPRQRTSGRKTARTPYPDANHGAGI